MNYPKLLADPMHASLQVQAGQPRGREPWIFSLPLAVRGAFAPPDWELVRLTTDTFWGSDADPVVATMREWFAADARFRRLIAERDLGDFLLCVAVRTSVAAQPANRDH